MALRLMIDGVSHAFVPIRAFRAAHGLPPDFGVALFEPKDYTGLGRIDGANAALATLRTTILNAITLSLSARSWLDEIDRLTALFETTLTHVNDEIGLREPEIGFAASGFADVCRAFAFARLRADTHKQPPPAFETVYDEWLSSTARISQMHHRYTHRGEDWSIQIVNHAYGRVGLIVAMPAETAHVHDSTLGCPAESYMRGLLAEVCARLMSARRQADNPQTP
ncbi:MAG: hypothetical protein CUN53_01925 [Phototrophicales bacterium]|nr:MAG: hypothetical protein CUN53_01925 [Phototrophicales bacterium]